MYGPDLIVLIMTTVGGGALDRAERLEHVVLDYGEDIGD